MLKPYDEKLLARVLPHYRNFHIIAHSSRGVVCSACGVLDGAPVAIKLTVDGGSQAHQVRFEREYQLLLTRQHPRILKVFRDHGRIAVPMASGGTRLHSYFTMELCTSDVGHALPRLTLPQRLTVVAQLFEGIRFLHVAGIAHRDIKPINLFLRGDPAHDGVQLKIGDFGIARDSRSQGLQTLGSGIIGTLGYLAPERLVPTEGMTTSADWFPSDQYAVGVTVFEILSGGTHPFRLDHEDTHPVADVGGIAHRAFRVPELGRPTPATERTLLRMMAPQIGDRFRDIHRAHDALNLAYTVDGIPVPWR